MSIANESARIQARQTRQSLDVRARELRMLDKRGDTIGGNGSTPQAQGQGGRDAWTQPQQSAPVSGDMDDIAF